MKRQEAFKIVKDLFLESSPYLHYCYTETSKRADWCMFFKPDFFVGVLSSEKHMGFDLEEKIGKSNYKALKDYCAWARENELGIQSDIKTKWDRYKRLQIQKGVPKEMVDSEFNFDLTFLVHSFTLYCESKNINLA